MSELLDLSSRNARREVPSRRWMREMGMCLRLSFACPGLLGSSPWLPHLPLPPAPDVASPPLRLLAVATTIIFSFPLVVQPCRSALAALVARFLPSGEASALV